MPNLILTTKCSNQCPFCFNLETPLTITIDDLSSWLPFITSSGFDEINILGGEPTLHPHFIEILELLKLRFSSIRIFTNGLISASNVEALQQMQSYNFSFCVNRTMPQLSNNTDFFYRKLGHMISIGFTFYESSQPLDHILQEIRGYRLSPHYRVGIALPDRKGDGNTFLALEEYPNAAEHLFQLIMDGLKLGLKPDFDCGFPYCFFSDEQMTFLSTNQVNFKSTCGVIPDILPNSTMIPCLPLADYYEPFTSAQDWNRIIENLNAQLDEKIIPWLYEHCKTCRSLQNGTCAGGCFALRKHNSNTGSINKVG